MVRQTPETPISNDYGPILEACLVEHSERIDLGDECSYIPVANLPSAAAEPYTGVYVTSGSSFKMSLQSVPGPQMRFVIVRGQVGYDQLGFKHISKVLPFWGLRVTVAERQAVRQTRRAFIERQQEAEHSAKYSH